MRVTFSRDALRVFSALVGDVSPVHVGEHAIVHAGLLTGALAGEAARQHPGMVVARIALDFIHPVRVGEEASVTVTVARDFSSAMTLFGVADGLDGGRVEGQIVMARWDRGRKEEA